MANDKLNAQNLLCLAASAVTRYKMLRIQFLIRYFLKMKIVKN